MSSRCSLCPNSFDSKYGIILLILTSKCNGVNWHANKVFFREEEFSGSIGQCLSILQEEVESFLLHVFIKRQQSAYFEKMKSYSADEIMCPGRFQ
jgi:hypothetical protein